MTPGLGLIQRTTLSQPESILGRTSEEPATTGVPITPSERGTWSSQAPIGISGSRRMLASNSVMIWLKWIATHE